jgi:group I intron endonuclease
MRSVYAITNTASNKMYVGQTVNLRNRRSNHLTALRGQKHKNPHLQAAYNKYGEAAFVFDILEDCPTVEEANEVERFYITYLRWLGITLYNVQEGGLGLSDTACQKIRQGTKGRVITQEWRDKIAKKARGRQYSDETKQKLSAMRKGKSHKGVPHTEEQKQRVSATLKGRPKSDDWKAKMTGKKRSEETCQKLSAALKGKPKSEEAKRKMSEAAKRRCEVNKGKPMSDYHRQRIQDSWDRRKAAKAQQQGDLFSE